LIPSSDARPDTLRPFLLLSFVAALVLFPTLHQGGLAGYDDAHYAHSAKEIVRSGDWLNIRYNGELDVNIPPLLMWAEALSMKAFGVSDFAAKFPAALAGFGTIVAVYFLAKELTSRKWLPHLAMIVLAATPYFMKFATHGMTDVPFAFFFTLSLLLFAVGLRRPWVMAFSGIPLGLGLLTRSVVGFLPLGVEALTLVAVARYRRSPRLLAGFGVAVLLAALVASVWYVPMMRLYGRGFWQLHLGFVSSKVSAADHPREGVLAYPLWLLKSYWPWLPFLVAGLAKQARAAVRDQDAGARLLLIWVLAVLVPFSLIDTKLMRYIMAAFPAFAILAAFPVDDWIPERFKARSVWGVAIAGCLAAIAAIVVPQAPERAVDMRTLAPLAERHTPAGRRILLYTPGETRWDYQNQLLWYQDRYVTMLDTKEGIAAEVASAGGATIVLAKTDAASLSLSGRSLAVLAESDRFVCAEIAAASRPAE
jgi:4-amino-4-deoxy-L-arabinose transferase-like glycosyltransferase